MKLYYRQCDPFKYFALGQIVWDLIRWCRDNLTMFVSIIKFLKLASFEMVLQLNIQLGT